MPDKLISEKVENDSNYIEVIDSRYSDITINLEPIILISKDREMVEKHKKALKVYKKLVETYSDFARMEKTTIEGYFPNLKAQNNLDLVYIIRYKLVDKINT